MNREQQLNQALEALFYGFSALTQQPDEQLSKLGFSRIHHRLLYFIARNPQVSVKELLNILGMSKQYIHKPLKQLTEQDFVTHTTDSKDKRVKRLSLSSKGEVLEHELSSTQREQFERVFKRSGKEAEQHWLQVMKLLAKHRHHQ